MCAQKTLTVEEEQAMLERHEAAMKLLKREPIDPCELLLAVICPSAAPLRELRA